jgi:hypothetical protein
MPRQKLFRDHCATCTKPTDPEVGAYSLIGHGWRLVPGLAPDGSETMNWQCPECRQRDGPSSGRVKIPDRKP